MIVADLHVFCLPEPRDELKPVAEIKPIQTPTVKVMNPGLTISTVSVRGKQFIKSFEQGPDSKGRGLPALKVYDDKDGKYYLDLQKENKLTGRPVGYWTIGYGRLLKKDANLTQQITPVQADEMFEQDIKRKSVDIITRNVKMRLTQEQFDALASYVYNTGSLVGTRVLKNINKGNMAVAVKEMDIVTTGGKRAGGLVKRRNAEHNIWINNRYEDHH